MTALACLVAAEEGVVDLDEPAGPPGSTIRHLLAHASGLPFEGAGPPLARPGTRRIYSNVGFEALADAVAERAEMPFDRVPARGGLRAAPDDPLRAPAARRRPTSTRRSTTSSASRASCRRRRSSRSRRSPRRRASSSPASPASSPGVGRYDPLDWGLGFELKDAKKGHWSGSRTSPQAFGHFGGSGTFLWVDPEPGIACACLTDREFDRWALEAWPRLSDAVLAETGLS